MGTTWFIARRYLWSKRRHPFVGVTGTISMLGIAVGVAALITVLAVMNGFDADLESRIIGLHAHLVVEKEGPFGDHEALAARLAVAAAVRATAPYVEGQALLQSGEWGTGVVVRGLDPGRERSVTDFHRHVKEGSFSGTPGRAVLGDELAKRAGLGVGSHFKLLTPKVDKPVDLAVEGLFSSGMYEYDANLLFLGLPEAQRLYGMGGGVTGLSVALRDPSRASVAKEAIVRSLGFPYYARTWMDSNRTLFAALKLEKIVMFLILALIILVACLNIAGSLTILVMDKTKDIGVLRAIGATPWDLVRIFACDGFLIGTAGASAGLGLGLGLCWALSRYRLVDLPPEIYYIDRLPVLLAPADAAAVVGVAVGLSFLSALYPALLAGKLDPVKALRYE